MQLREAKQAIREFIRLHWSDQKLIEVYAFNRDGKMNVMSACACILGCTLTETLHVNCIPGGHYSEARSTLRGAREAEHGYMLLGYLSSADGVSQRRLSAILRAEIRRRERIAEQARLSREAAILALASGFKMQRADVECLEALSETACPTADLAELVGMSLFHAEGD